MSYATRSLYVARSRRKAGVVPNQGSPLTPKGLGDAQNSSLDVVGSALRRLAPHAKDMKSFLQPGVQQDFRTVTSAVAILRGTEHYERLKQMILNTFPEIYDVGTVGAYFVNCRDSAARDACSAPCVGNLILDYGAEGVCPVRVFALKFEGNSTRSLLALNEAPDTTRAIVYLYLDPTRKMGGLTAGEIASIANLGVKEVNVFYYDPQTFDQMPITSDFVPIESLVPVPSYTPEDNSGFWKVLLVVLAALAILFAVWRYARKPK